MTHCATDVGLNTMLQKDRKFKLSLKMMKATMNTFPHQNVQNPALYQIHLLFLCRSSTSKSHAQCFLCKRPGPKLVVVPSNARFDVFMNCEIIVQRVVDVVPIIWKMVNLKPICCIA